MSGISSYSLKVLTEAFSERLRDVMPAESTVRVSPEEIEWKLDSLINQPGDLAENLSLAAMSILSTYQDRIIRDLKRGWPPSGRCHDGVYDSGDDLPWPDVEIASGRLRLWFGEKDDPALELQPLYV